jgi:hypothetical protein
LLGLVLRIDKFFSSATRDELSLLYISGHGVKDEDGSLYFAVSDTDRHLLLSTAIPLAFITALSGRRGRLACLLHGALLG